MGTTEEDSQPNVESIDHVLEALGHQIDQLNGRLNGLTSEMVRLFYILVL